MNTKNYLKINDETTYKIVESNCDAKVMKVTAKVIEKYKDNLTKKEKNILQVSHITQVIYLASLKFTNLNLFKMRSKNNKKSMHVLLNHQT